MTTSWRNHLSIDIETYSSVDLNKSGVYRYAESKDFEILLFGYSLNGEPVKVVDVASGEEIPSHILQFLEDDTCLKSAFNSIFERICLSRFLGYPTGKYLNPDSWHCDMVWSAYMGLPLSLKGVGSVLNLDKQKLDEGKELIKYFCVPCLPTKANGQRTRNLPSDEPEKWELFKKYNARDVETEMAIQNKLSKFPVPDFVWDEYHLDQRINDTGILLDLKLVASAIDMDAKSKAELTEKAKRLTSLDNPSSVKQLKEYLATIGCEAESLGKKQIAELLKEANDDVREILELRLQLAKSSVKKYQAMQSCACNDGRARGTFMFYGANRTGRYSSKLIQLQNLPQNHIADLALARGLVRDGRYDDVNMLYGDVPDTLSQLIRTALVPAKGKKFIVSDFSAIEARVIAWLAGEQWRNDLFKAGGDIYCQSASQMFKVPVEKHGTNRHLRQKGKIAELACIAEGSLVLTNKGLVPIEKVTKDMLLWDGESWVKHGGVIFKGTREVITYEGLTATKDHLVWVYGKQEPIQFGIAASCGAHLVKTGNGRTPIRMGKNHQSGKTVEQENESLLCVNEMHGLWFDSMADSGQPKEWKKQGLPTVLSTETNSEMAGQAPNGCKTTMRKSDGQCLQKLWCKRHQVSISEHSGCGYISNFNFRTSGKEYGNRSNRYKQGLCTGEYKICTSSSELCESKAKCSNGIFSRILAVLLYNRNKEIISWNDQRANNTGCKKGSIGKTKKLDVNIGTARLYDIRDAGQHHRFTVSGCLVHNCGYGGGVGAMIAMGALDMGLEESELQDIVTKWRDASPNIVKFWWEVDKAAKKAITEKCKVELAHGIVIECYSGMMFITLPSGRKLAYVKPKIEMNQFGSESITYEGSDSTKKWNRIESYGPKLVENIVQATARDILCFSLSNLKDYKIEATVHDEVIIEADKDTKVETITEIMGHTPSWAEGLILRADGYECEFYKKD